MNDENLITFNQMQPERHKELSRLGGIASGQTRARRAYMKAAAREMQLRMVYFKDADADLKAEWAEFQRQEPLCRCDSLDAPLDAEDDGSATRGDTVPDAAAEQAFNDADECLYTAQLHSALDDALALLDERQATVLRGRFYEGRTLESLAVQLGISRERVRQTESKAIRAMRFPRIQRKLEAYRENILSGGVYHGAGFTAWKERGSIEERIAERIEAHTERYTADAFIADMMKIYQCSRAEVLQRFPELCG